ncbi:GNAT family N-acetyltransferase [Roseospira visakhapatnamensis]|uniref:Phosphinothricin acetyltransferase n=1 Tax=Roseospira visakhapatnamensis TaxID=390880 RepID=A0A7W6RAQ9_9PROT|nr:GNAT family N-acetyltransferase [Roseospira visakhapatnamensis]MBB4265044.1 phosphinothricin acetyltransferase [Roseospira visakhapatnamensis]
MSVDPASPVSTTRPPPAVHIAEATARDAADIQALYAHHVRHGTATFETEPPPVDEMALRIAAVRDQHLPYLTARAAATGALLGYAYAGPFRARAAYRHTVEDSIYLAPQAAGQGLGTRLLADLIDRCQARGDIHQMIAVITSPGSEASVALHRRLGFQVVGTLVAVGRKNGRWLDTLYMQREIGAGTPPA